MRLKKDHTTVPFHYHLREDEAFYILSGRGVLRYGDDLREIRAGDCISCPAGTKIAHQIANLGHVRIGNFRQRLADVDAFASGGAQHDLPQ